jgi:hypothetical protein
MDYTALRNVLNTPPYNTMDDADAANALNTNMTQIPAGVITVNDFCVRAEKPLSVLLAANKGDAVRAPFEGLLGLLAVPGVTTVDTPLSTVQAALNLAASESIGGYTAADAQATYEDTVTVAVATVGQPVTADDVEVARR